MGCKCSKCCKPKPLEKRLEGNKLYEIYEAALDEPHAPSTDPAFTRAQLALRLDILRGKLMWTGCKSQDFKYYLWFNHPFLSIFAANPVDCFTRAERGAVLFMQICLNALVSFMTLYFQKLKLQETNAARAEYYQNIIWALTVGGAIFLTIIVGVLKLLATCSCIQGIRCWGNWKCCCLSGPCCVSYIRCCFETIGTFGLLVFGIISTVTIIAVIYVSNTMGMADTFFATFFENLVYSWGGAVAMHFVMFYKMNYKKESKKLLEGKTKFEMTCTDIEAKGLEIEYRAACSKCLTCCLPFWRILTAVMMFSDKNDFKVVKSVNEAMETETIVVDENGEPEEVEDEKEEWPTEELRQAETTEEPSKAKPTEESSQGEPTEEPSKAETTEEPAQAEPTEEPGKAEPTEEPAEAEPTEEPSKAEEAQ